MSTHSSPRTSYYYYNIVINTNKEDFIVTSCKECVNYSFGKCKLFTETSLLSARKYFCQGLYFFKRR